MSVNRLEIDISTSPNFEEDRSVLKKIVLDGNGLIMDNKDPVEVPIELNDDYLNTKLYSRAVYHHATHDPKDDKDDPISDTISFSMTDHHVLYSYAVGLALDDYSKEGFIKHSTNQILMDYRGNYYPISLPIHNPKVNRVLNELVEIVDKTDNPNYTCKVLKINKLFIKALETGIKGTPTENKPTWLVSTVRLDSTYVVHPAFLRSRTREDGVIEHYELSSIEYHIGLPGGITPDEMELNYSGDVNGLYLSGVTYNANKRILKEKFPGIMETKRFYNFFDACLLYLVKLVYNGFTVFTDTEKYPGVKEKADNVLKHIDLFYRGGQENGHYYGIFTDGIKINKSSIQILDNLNNVVHVLPTVEGSGWFETGDLSGSFTVGKTKIPWMVCFGQGKTFKSVVSNPVNSLGGSIFPIEGEGSDVVTGIGGIDVFYPQVQVGVTTQKTYFQMYAKNIRHPLLRSLYAHEWTDYLAGINFSCPRAKKVMIPTTMPYFTHLRMNGMWRNQCPTFNHQEYICSDKSDQTYYLWKQCQFDGMYENSFGGRRCRTYCGLGRGHYPHAAYPTPICQEYNTGVGTYDYATVEDKNACAEGHCKGIGQEAGIPIYQDRDVALPFHPLNIVVTNYSKRLGLKKIYGTTPDDNKSHYPFPRLVVDNI